MDTTTAPTVAAGSVPLAAAGTALASAIAAAALSLASAALAVPQLPQLAPPAVAGFAALGAVLAVLGWQAVRRRARDPRRTLSWLVPVLLIASFVPDALLGVTTAATTGVGPVLTLAAMHVTTVLITVPVALRVLPLPRSRTAPTAG